jgi:Zn-dependent protease
METAHLLVFAFGFLGAVLGTCLHEFGHALVAYKGGDTTVRDKGYLTLNPFKYAHPLMSLGLPLIFLALGGIPLPGGAVYVDTSRLRSRTWDCLVSLAGPGMTLAFVLVLAVPFLLGIYNPQSPLWAAWAFLLVVEIAAFFLNLIPIPPLDGFGAIAPFLDRNLRRQIQSIGTTGIIVLFLVLSFAKGPNRVFWDAVSFSAELLGVPPGLWWDGYKMFMFWKH